MKSYHDDDCPMARCVCGTLARAHVDTHETLIDASDSHDDCECDVTFDGMIYSPRVDTRDVFRLGAVAATVIVMSFMAMRLVAGLGNWSLAGLLLVAVGACWRLLEEDEAAR